METLGGHLGDRFQAVKVDAHVERKGRERTLHEWGNHFADRYADVCIHRDWEDTPVVMALKEAIHVNKFRSSSRWRTYDHSGVEITRGVRQEEKVRCQRLAQARDQANREGRERLTTDPRITKMVSTKLKKAVWGPVIDTVGEDEDGIDPPRDRAREKAGWRGGGNQYRQAQLCKFLNKRLVTQNVKEERSRDKARHACQLCKEDVEVNNNHILFLCCHPGLVEARRAWMGRVRKAWASTSLAVELKKLADWLWQVDGDGRMRANGGDEAHWEEMGVDLDLLGRIFPPETMRPLDSVWRGIWGREWADVAFELENSPKNTRMASILRDLAEVLAVVRTDWRLVWEVHNKLTHVRTLHPIGKRAVHMLRRWRKCVGIIRGALEAHSKAKVAPSEEVLAAMEQPEQLEKLEGWLERGKIPMIPRRGSITAALGHKEDWLLLHRGRGRKSKWSSWKGPEQRKLEKVETTGNSENEGAEEEKLGQNEPW